MLLTGTLPAWLSGLGPEGPSRPWEMGQGEQTGGHGGDVFGIREETAQPPPSHSDDAEAGTGVRRAPGTDIQR